MGFLDYDGLLYFWQSIKTKFATKAEVDAKAAVGHKHAIADTTGLQAALDAKASTGTATTDAAGLMSAADKSKLDGIEEGATKTSSMTGATASTNGKAGLVPAPSAGNQDYYLKADGTWTAIVAANAAAHNAIYRGSDISAMEANGTLYTNIANGTFKDVFVGDYFRKSINGTDYVLRIAALDYYYGFGNTAFNTHHAVIVPDAIFGVARMNSSNVVTGGYIGTKMRTETLQTWLGYLKTAFGSHLLTPRCLYDNVCNGSSYSGASWYDGSLELMTEEQVYGARQHGITNHLGWCYPGVDYAQFPLFALDHSRICNRSHWWLRSVYSSTDFSYVSYDGHSHTCGASNSQGVRPRFLIG